MAENSVLGILVIHGELLKIGPKGLALKMDRLWDWTFKDNEW